MIRPRPRGFTLIELLVVIAIIAILAAILFPAMVTVKEKGRQATCLSNEKQMYTGLMMYANDYADVLPVAYAIYSGTVTRTDTYSYLIRPYLRNWRVMSCPSRPTVETPQWDGRCGYLMTTDISNWTVDGALRRGTPLSEFHDQKTILLLDGPVYPPLYIGSWQTYNWGSTDAALPPLDFAKALNNQGVYKAYYYKFMVRHNNGLNCTSVDGHSAYIRSGGFTESMFTKKRD